VLHQRRWVLPPIRALFQLIQLSFWTGRLFILYTRCANMSWSTKRQQE
jgi:hypothetical protein